MRSVLCIRLVPSVVALFLTFVPVNPALAAFILDDFDDPVQIVLPEMRGTTVITENVGQLDAERWIELYGDARDSVGSLDSNISTASTLTGIVDRLGTGTPMFDPIMAIFVRYIFDDTDFSEGGTNNAIFLDFNFMTSETPPAKFSLFVYDSSVYQWYGTNPDTDFAPAPTSADPFTIAIPFSSLRDNRGRGDGTSSLEHASSLKFAIAVHEGFGGGPDPINFRMQLDAVRVGALPVPEASTQILAFIGTFFSLAFFRRPWN